MPSTIRCFMLTPTDHVTVRLRRFASPRDGAPPCTRREPRYPGGDVVTFEVHDVEVEVAREHGTLEPGTDAATRHTVTDDDPRWPTRCTCGHVFDVAATRQEWHTRLYERGDTHELVTISDAPAGALYDRGGFTHRADYHRNGDGQSIMCKTPAGEWLIDGPASNGSGWTRRGTLPDITVTPSIAIGQPMRMHGWLGGPGGDRPGWLVIDLP